MFIWITVVARFGKREVTLFDPKRMQAGNVMPPVIASFTFDSAEDEPTLIRKALREHYGYVSAGLFLVKDNKRMWSAKW